MYVVLFRIYKYQKMNWITQNAPFGTDNTPVLNIKIVGGKRVEVLAKQRENGDVER